jgi:hypothetical protein
MDELQRFDDDIIDIWVEMEMEAFENEADEIEMLGGMTRETTKKVLMTERQKSSGTKYC